MDSDGEFRYVLKPLSSHSFCGEWSVVPGKLYVIGRSRSCEFVLKDGRVSRRQCQVFVDPQTRALVLFHGVLDVGSVGSMGEMFAGKRKCVELDLEAASYVGVDGGKVAVGEFKALAPGCKVELVVHVRSLPEIGFQVGLEKVVAFGKSVRCLLKEVNINVLKETREDQVRAKRLKVEKLIQESRELRHEVHATSLGCIVLPEQSRHASLTVSTVSIEHSEAAMPVMQDSHDRDDLGKPQANLEATKTHETTYMASEIVVSKVESLGLQDPELPSGFCLNLLENSEPMKGQVSLMQLLDPVQELQAILLASFTTDILWFVSSANLPKTLPITLASHDTERSWSTSVNDRFHYPYPEWPNLKVLYPPFPVLRRTNDKSSMRGIGCHHPKLILMKRPGSIRVVVMSANLNYRQWFQVSNTVWWQDFPLRCTKNFESLFGIKQPSDLPTTGDFAAQLAAFVSCLVKDVPSEAHWAVNLASYDFSKAAVSLVMSVPGFHNAPLRRPPDKAYLGTIISSVVGISYNYHPKADPNGSRLRKLAGIINTMNCDSEGMVSVQLRRANLPVDPNAVSVFAVSKQELLPSGDEIHIGFLPKRAAQWVSSLWDGGFCEFSARLWPKQLIAVASGQVLSVVELVLLVSQGSSFRELPSKLLTETQASSMTSLLRHIQRNYGIWRVQEVLSTQKWPDVAETDFMYCSSSIGTSLSPKFVAAFSAAAGRKATSDDEYESDPEWGCWTDQHEKLRPSIKILFPRITQVRDSQNGPSAYRGILYFPEKTWERVQTTCNLYDAVPFPPNRTGYPMHVKVACRRFRSSSSKRNFGWIYTGSHNFSPAAWGKLVNRPSSEDEFGRKCSNARLHICNYELGVIFMDPDNNASSVVCMIDDFTLPFLVPAPKYSNADKPATGRAIYDLVQKIGEEERSVLNEAGERETVLPSEIELETEDSDDDACSSEYVEQLLPHYQAFA